ncbi:ribonuclease E [Pontimonas salivibrio]|uniref:Ribonuclease E n=1 Tax=Pontimonas salivibrio TaxID=1159327 RepID=A0A2L2BPZ1_9MICO|nr:Rne/Rng family ribonuclease [Pontimonas salivibrio]AVG23741.1 ribonuclease E [Pontimonas salivibrio]
MVNKSTENSQDEKSSTTKTPKKTTSTPATKRSASTGSGEKTPAESKKKAPARSSKASAVKGEKSSNKAEKTDDPQSTSDKTSSQKNPRAGAGRPKGTAESKKVPLTPSSPTQLVFAGPDPALFQKFQENAEPAERNVRKRQRSARPQVEAEPSTPQKTRTSRTKDDAPSQPQKVRGSTRLEAKRQRRREGRDQGRRRAVVTESEFLARRESVERVMVVREKDSRTQIAVLEDGVAVEHYVAKNDEASLIGNVYLGRVQNVLPSMEAAFVDIGRGRNAVLYSGEVDWDAATEEGGERPKKIEAALKTGDSVLVQVTKDPIGHKGARLTSQVSLPGRYLVYVPSGGMNGISRKLPDTERSRLKAILKTVVPETAGVIVRTAAEGATEEQLTSDVQRLQLQWDSLQKEVGQKKAPALLHSEPDLLVKIIRDVFNEDFHKLVIAGDDQHRVITEYLAQVAPDLMERIEVYQGEGDPFDEYRVNESIHKALERKVWLPSGGSLVIDRTEAMTVVDVNTGKFVGSGGNLEETVTKNNVEAAEEIVRQLRLRDIGGIIVIDFIDMVLESNRDLVLRRLVECLSRDRTKHQVAEVTSLGLVQMTRKRLGLGLLETFSETCEHCQGRGVVVQSEPVGKSKQSGSSDSGNKRRKSSTNSRTATIEPHQITDDARAAIAQIAAGTVGGSSAEASPDSPPTAEQAPPKSSADAAALQQDDVLGLSELVEAKKNRPSRRAKKSTEVLDVVLSALPEPPAAGQSRRRRRASSGGVVSPGDDVSRDGGDS